MIICFAIQKYADTDAVKHHIGCCSIAGKEKFPLSRSTNMFDSPLVVKGILL
jgi:hypothetical protein